MAKYFYIPEGKKQKQKPLQYLLRAAHAWRSFFVIKVNQDKVWGWHQGAGQVANKEKSDPQKLK